MIDSHCHLADEVFAADLEAVDRPRAGRRARARARHPRRRRRERSGAGRTRRSALARGPLRDRRPSAPGAPVRRPTRSAPATSSGSSSPRRRRRGPSARSASTTTTTSRRATSSTTVFRAQLRLARELRLPGRHPHARGRRRHDRDPRARRAAARSRGVLHCFTGGPSLARAGLDLGFYISLAGIVTFPKAADAARDGARGAARSAADRNRQPVSRAGAASRQAERAGATSRASRTALAATARPRRATTWPARTTANFHTPLPAVIKSYRKPLWKSRRSPCRRSSSRFAPTSRQVDREFARHVQSQVELIPQDRPVHPDERRQAGPSGRAADGGAPERLPGRSRDPLRRRRRVHPHRDAGPRRHHRRLGAAPRPPGRALAVGQRHHRAARATTCTSSRWRWRSRTTRSTSSGCCATSRCKMIEGELYQLTKNGDADITEDEHFDIIRRKTAYLFGGCAQIGGMLGQGVERAGAGAARVRLQPRHRVPDRGRPARLHRRRRGGRQADRQRSARRQGDAAADPPAAAVERRRRRRRIVRDIIASRTVAPRAVDGAAAPA